MRIPLIAANWKMNKTTDEAISFAEDILIDMENLDGVEVLICPPFTSLSVLNQLFSASKVKLGAQNIYFEKRGAFTGEISGEMINEFCSYVLVGHSERRHIFGEDNETINKKLKTALEAGLSVVLCIGETLEERKAKKTIEVVEEQLKKGLDGVTAEDMKKIVLAYEPVWAIGTGITATPEQAEGAHAYIRDIIKKMYEIGVAQDIRILYGGSVKPENVKTLMDQYDIDGVLVGGASLDPKSFIQLVNYKEN